MKDESMLELFTGRDLAIMRCKACEGHRESPSGETFRSLSVSLQRPCGAYVSSVQEAVEVYFHPEQIAVRVPGVCSDASCNADQGFEKLRLVRGMPKALVIQMKLWDAQQEKLGRCIMPERVLQVHSETYRLRSAACHQGERITWTLLVSRSM